MFQVSSQLLLYVCPLQTLPQPWPLVILLRFLRRCLCQAAHPAWLSFLGIVFPLTLGPGLILEEQFKVCCIPAADPAPPSPSKQSSCIFHLRPGC